MWPERNRVWASERATTLQNIAEDRLWWGVNHELEKPRKKSFLSEVKAGIIPDTLWLRTETGDNQDARREIRALAPNLDFDTPKPERLLERVLQISTDQGDLVLDSFLGSGTTAAVAHKMGRQYIGIELGDHAITHCQPRLVKVIDGEQGGISKAVEWQGGGGFRFYNLGDTVFDENGQILSNIAYAALASHVWFSETATPLATARRKSLFLGIHKGIGFALLYNGILGDKSAQGGNVLTRTTLDLIHAAAGDFDGPLVIYGERAAFGAATLEREGITFKQTPCDVKARR